MPVALARNCRAGPCKPSSVVRTVVWSNVISGLIPIFATLVCARALINVTVYGPPLGPVTAILPFKAGIWLRLFWIDAAAPTWPLAGRALPLVSVETDPTGAGCPTDGGV